MPPARLVLGLLMLVSGCSIPARRTAAPRPELSAPEVPEAAGPLAPPAPGRVGPVEAEQPRPLDAPADPAARIGPPVWGVVGARGFATGARVAPNGVGFDPLFSLDLNFNVWLWRRQGLYAYEDTRFWGQRAAPGITNRSQGVFDFSKREFDQDIGLAWNYYGNLELRAFAYSNNNLNRGSSTARPTGYKDGAGVESRWYVGGSYPRLGTPEFDVTRATFLSVGYYPTKEMVDGEGDGFKPGPFARAYLTLYLLGPRAYLYLDAQAIGDRSARPRLLSADVGVAVRPFVGVPYLELRLGSEDKFDVRAHEWAPTVYGAVRVAY